MTLTADGDVSTRVLRNLRVYSHVGVAYMHRVRDNTLHFIHCILDLVILNVYYNFTLKYYVKITGFIN